MWLAASSLCRRVKFTQIQTGGKNGTMDSLQRMNEVKPKRKRKEVGIPS